MNLFITTSRKPSAQTRKLARWFARLLGGECENRGKRSVDEVMQRAAAQGFSRVLFIHDKNGNPAELVFRDEAEGWLEPSIGVSGTVIPEKGSGPRVRATDEVKAKTLDSAGEKIAALFGLSESSNEDALVLIAGAKEIFFETAEGERAGPAIKIARLSKRSE